MPRNTSAALLAAAALFAIASPALAESGGNHLVLTLDPLATTVDPPAAAPPPAPAPDTLLMSLGHASGITQPLENAGIFFYGWIDAGYTWDHRSRGHNGPVILGVAKYGTHQQQNHAYLDQLALRFERTVATDKWDVGGLIEVMYGSDTNAIHSNGLSFGNETRTGKGGSPNADDRFSPLYQFDITQAYVDIGVPLGNGLKIRAGKFAGLLGYETTDPRTTPFYSRSYLFNAPAYTHTGIMANYTVNDQWEVGGSIVRGNDQTLEDNNDAIAFVSHLLWKPSKQWSFTLNVQTGPENDNDNSHYRTNPDFIATWQATDKLSFALELLYACDGGRNGAAPALSHAYGDVWGAAFYTQYVFNDYCTGNLRVEKYHDFVNSFNVFNPVGPGIPTVNAYEITLGLTLHPFPKDPIGKSLLFRPEIRYDFSEDHVFQAGNSVFRDQLTFAADMIYSF